MKQYPTLNIINPLSPPVPCKVLKGVAKLPPSLLPLTYTCDAVANADKQTFDVGGSKTA